MTAIPAPDSATSSALVLAGGIALGAFEAGAYAGLDKAGLAGTLRWVAGSSIGAVCACIVAGNAPENRVERLRAFWARVTSDPLPAATFWFGGARSGLWRETYNQAGVWQTLLLGRPGLFQPRLSSRPMAGVRDVRAIYDLAPLRTHLAAVIDFARLNDGSVRVSLAATDVVSGDRVVFDTGRGCILTPDHILASCALLPLFAPIEVDGRLLGDGGLSANTPLDLILGTPEARGLRCFVVDLFAREGSRPHTLAASASRAGDLTFGNQTARLLEAQAREDRLRMHISHLGALLTPAQRAQAYTAAILTEGREAASDIVMISYRAGLDEAGLGKPFDFSTATIDDRWRAGEREIRAALAQNEAP